MGTPVFIEGDTGSGKTFSLRNLPVEGTAILEVEKQHLPFKSKLSGVMVKNAGYAEIGKTLQNKNLKRVIIDDSQYLLVNEFFDRAKETGYQKFTDIALRFRNVIHFVNQRTPDDMIVYFLHHTELDANGKTKAKTIGKMLDEKLTLEGCFDIVLHAVVENKEHVFITNGGEYDSAKTPYQMFNADRIPNDLNAVDQAIREYYGLGGDTDG